MSTVKEKIANRGKQEALWDSYSREDLVEALAEAEIEKSKLRKELEIARRKSNARKRALRTLNQSMLGKNAQLRNGFEDALKAALGFEVAE